MKPPYPWVKLDHQPRDIARHKALKAWTAIKQRAENRRGNKPTYAGIKIRITKDEFLRWAIPEYRKWFKEHPGVVAFIDRRDNSGHYQLSNMRLVTRLVSASNQRHPGKPRRDPAGFHFCVKCGSLLPLQRFYSKPGRLCRRHDDQRKEDWRRQRRALGLPLK